MGVSLGASFDLAAQVGGKLDRANRLLERSVRLSHRRTTPIVGSIVGIAGQIAATTIAGPEGGLEWHVRRITLAPQLSAGVGAVTTAGTIIVAKSTGVLTTAQGSGQVVTGGLQVIEITRTTTVPNALVFSHAQCVINYPNNLIVLWASGTANLPLVIDGDAVELFANVDDDTGA